MCMFHILFLKEDPKVHSGSPTNPGSIPTHPPRLVGRPGDSVQKRLPFVADAHAEPPLPPFQPLDYEISAFHTLLIKVENEDPLVPDVSYGPSSTATVHITVLDVNEGPVFYPDPMMVTRQENISVGSVLLTVNATDPDSLQHQTIRWVCGFLTGKWRQAGRHCVSFPGFPSCQEQISIKLNLLAICVSRRHMSL